MQIGEGEKSSKAIQPIATYFFKVSQLAHYSFCPHRCRVELFNLAKPYSNGGNKAMVTGTEMHKSYNSWAKSFDRMKLLYQLKYQCKLPYTRRLDNIEVRGIFDDIRVIRDSHTNEKFVSFVELKTTAKKRMWNCEVESAKFQLCLYIWVLSPILSKLGWKLGKHHFLEIYSQQTHKLIRRIVVTEDKSIEDRIRYIIRSFQGIEPIRYPPDYTCKICPKNVKEVCNKYQSSRKVIW